MDAEREYMKLFSSGKYTECDAAGFAYVAERHARFYLETAERYYKEAVEIGAASKSDAYYKNQRQYILFLSRIGRSQESIDVFRRLVDEEPENPMNYISPVSYTHLDVYKRQPFRRRHRNGGRPLGKNRYALHDDSGADTA